MVEAVKVVVRESTVGKILDNLSRYPEIDITVNWKTASRLTGTKTTLNVLCNHCNQETLRGASDLLSNKFRCAGCLISKYKKCADIAGVNYISHTASKIIVQCRVCDTHLNCNASELRMGYKPRCGKCLDNKYTSAAIATGYTYLGKTVVKGQTVVNLQCPVDGINFFVSASSLLKYKVACLECRINRYREILLTKNCIFLEILSEKGKDSRIRYMNQEGEIFDALICSITQNSFATSTENHWCDSHSTYLILNEIEDKIYCKIGTAKVPTKRLQDLKLIGSTSVVTLATFEDRFEADALESSLHKEFKDYKLLPETAKQFSRKLLRRRKQGKAERVVVHDGIHEWFTHEVYDILKHRYKLE